jgi:PAS domain S-box-containing protein
MEQLRQASAVVGGGYSGLIVGAGAMAERVRTHPWGATVLGPIERWSPSLVAMVNLMLNTPAAAAVFWGPEMIFLGNDTSAQMMGPRAVECLGAPARELLGEHWGEVGDWFLGVLSTGEPFHGENLPFHFPEFQKPDEFFINYTLSPIHEDGKVAGIYRVLEETTEAVLAMRALAESNERLRMALSAGGNVGIWDWHIEKGLVYADENTAKLYGIDPKAAAVGTSNLLYERMLHPEDIPVLTDAIVGCIATGEPYTAEYRVRRADGSYGWVESMGRCVYDADGHACRVTGIKLDVTERRNARAASQVSAPEAELLPREEWAKIPAEVRLLIQGACYALADKPCEIRLRVVPGAKETQIVLLVAGSDLGKIIGKQGRTVRCIRTLLQATNRPGSHRHTLDIEAKPA